MDEDGELSPTLSEYDFKLIDAAQFSEAKELGYTLFDLIERNVR